MNVIDRAKEYAHAAHDSIGQVRKYSHEPYWVHTDEVAATVATVTDSPVVIAAAHLHDVLEDVPAEPEAPYSLEHMRAKFGKEVTLLVQHLTDVFVAKHYTYINRAARKELERYRLGLTPAEVHTVKLADLISNTRSIVEYDPDFAKVYLNEKRLMLPFLRRGDSRLMEIAQEQIKDL